METRNGLAALPLVASTAAEIRMRAAVDHLSKRASDRLSNRTDTAAEVGPLVIFIVAAAIVLALAVTLAAGVALYCIQKGGNAEWWTRNGWKVWELKIACRMH